MNDGRAQAFGLKIWESSGGIHGTIVNAHFLHIARKLQKLVIRRLGLADAGSVNPARAGHLDTALLLAFFVSISSWVHTLAI
jgi:hypothetical protein